MKLLNHTHVRAFALEVSKQHRNGRFKRVSAEFMEKLEASIKARIVSEVTRHPSLGITLK